MQIPRDNRHNMLRRNNAENHLESLLLDALKHRPMTIGEIKAFLYFPKESTLFLLRSLEKMKLIYREGEWWYFGERD